MADLNVLMREQALAGLQTQLDTAVTNGDTEAARKVTQDIAALAVQTAPKAPPFGQADITAELDKQTWFGIDPKKSAKVVELGKTMDPKKFPTAAAFAEALVKAVEEDFKPADKTPPEDAEDEDDEEDENGKKAAAEKKPRKTDGPGEGDNTNRVTRRTTAGPWGKMSDAPPEVQKEIRRSMDKLMSSNAPEAQRKTFIAKALESHYATAQRNKGKK